MAGKLYSENIAGIANLKPLGPLSLIWVSGAGECKALQNNNRK
jgi:hypothetical protein